MKISEIHAKKDKVTSLEIFPPKKEAGGIDTIYSTLDSLCGLTPDFISVTYSAGGSGGNDATARIASIIKHKYNTSSIAHLTCIGSTEKKIDEALNLICAEGVENVLALRGDIMPGSPGIGQFRFARDLIVKIKRDHPEICVGAAAYPEGHIACEDLKQDIEHLREKVDAGADFCVTQLFFDNEKYYKFMDLTAAAGINVPISAGIMPIISKNQIQKMIFMCGASLPSEIIKLLCRYENDPESLENAAIEYSAAQIRDLYSHGFSKIHLYTMNRPQIAAKTLSRI